MKAGEWNTGPHASTAVCDRPACIDDAKAWAYALTHLEAVFLPDPQPASA